MHHREFISKLYCQLDGDFSRYELTTIVETLSKVIAQTLAKGEDISITNLGKFSIKELSARKYYNIHTGKMEFCASRKIAVFTPSSKLQNRMIDD